MIEIYTGDGKGKTTAAAGLAVRAAGAGIRVLFAQFLKDDSSGEISILRTLRGVEVLHAPEVFGFTFLMSEEQKEKTGQFCRELLAEVCSKIHSYKSHSPADQGSPGTVNCVIIMDEILHALREGFVTEDALRQVLDLADPQTEMILTGWEIPGWLEERADYISEIRKIRHPYDKGIDGRRGIEF